MARPETRGSVGHQIVVAFQVDHPSALASPPLDLDDEPVDEAALLVPMASPTQIDDIPVHHDEVRPPSRQGQVLEPVGMLIGARHPSQMDIREEDGLGCVMHIRGAG